MGKLIVVSIPAANPGSIYVSPSFFFLSITRFEIEHNTEARYSFSTQFNLKPIESYGDFPLIYYS